MGNTRPSLFGIKRREEKIIEGVADAKHNAEKSCTSFFVHPMCTRIFILGIKVCYLNFMKTDPSSMLKVMV